MAKVGERVGAISHSEGEAIYLFGYGVYEGDFIPDTAGGSMGELSRKTGLVNPKITLDSGKVVWGCECWWGPEDKVRKTIEGRTIVEADIDESRKNFAALARGNSGDTYGSQDAEYVKVMQDIKEDLPGLDGIKTLFQAILADYAGHFSTDAVQSISMQLLATVNLLQDQGILAEGLTSFSVDVNTPIVGETDFETPGAGPTEPTHAQRDALRAETEIEATLGLILPNGKKVTLTLVLKKPTLKTT